MKFLCIGYADEKKWEALPGAEQEALIKECFAYDDTLKANGHFVGGEALQSAKTAKILRWGNGKVSIIDGPYAETKEQIGGVLVLEARDLDHAVQLFSQHPGVRMGSIFEIRPIDEEFTARANARKPQAARAGQRPKS